MTDAPAAAFGVSRWPGGASGELLGDAAHQHRPGDPPLNGELGLDWLEDAPERLALLDADMGLAAAPRHVAAALPAAELPGADQLAPLAQQEVLAKADTRITGAAAGTCSGIQAPVAYVRSTPA